jgi:predicted dehydrogenase
MLKTAIIGLGPHGQRILSACLQIPELEIIGLVDKNNEALHKALPGRTEIYFNKTEDLYNSQNKPEVVIVATNGPSHHPLTIEAIAYGVKYIMVEKPMACSVKEALEMEEAARIGSVRLSIDKPIRHDDLYVWLHNQIISGEWGPMRNIYTQKPGIGLGCLGTHSFDLSNYLMNDFPSRVTAWIDEPIGKNPRGEQFIDPGGLVVLEYSKNRRAIITQIEDGAGPQSIEINLTGARIYHDTKNGFVDIRKRDLSIKPGPTQPVVYHKIEPENTCNIKSDLLKMIKHVILELISDKPMKTDAVYGRNTIEILTAAYISQQRGNIPVDIRSLNAEEKSIYLPIT